jgi:hypothetical protein
MAIACGLMQFFHMRDDETKSWHNYLVIPLGKEEFSALQARFDSQVPKLSCWAMIRKGRPYVVFDYGGTICFSETFGSGETLGDKLTVGDVLTVILTDKPQDKLFLFSKDSLVLNFGLEEVIVYPFTYNKEMEEIYDFYKHYANLKDNKTNITIKKKSKRLSLR